MSNTSPPLPVHSLSKQEFPVHVRRIEYKNPYDFTREHRHDYFEIFFFEQGGGNQLIDFNEWPVHANSSYIVFPQQIHLLKRDPHACGKLVQFREDVVSSTQIRILLRQLSFGENAAILFENNADKILKLGVIIDLLKESSEKQSDHSHEITLHYLQALLLQLLECRDQGKAMETSADHKILFGFQHLLEEQFLQNHLVSRYAALLNITERKLSTITKKYLGLSPLQVIHDRLLLEAKRMLLFEISSYKEIAFHLGFDSPASFSLFIKNKTGLTPSELNLHLVNIHK